MPLLFHATYGCEDLKSPRACAQAQLKLIKRQTLPLVGLKDRARLRKKPHDLRKPAVCSCMKSDMLRALKLGIALLSMDSGIIANTSACQHVERGCHRMCVICFCPNHPCWCSQVPSQYPLTIKRISGHRAVQWLKSQEKPHETSGLPLFAFCPPPARIAVHNTRKWRGSSLANPLLCQNGKGHKGKPHDYLSDEAIDRHLARLGGHCHPESHGDPLLQTRAQVLRTGVLSDSQVAMTEVRLSIRLP